MCGRCCLTLRPSEIQQICKYDKNGEEIIPEIRAEYNFGKKYEPSANIAPSEITPVLVSSDHFEASGNNNVPNQQMRHCIIPMLWGMIPFWHKGDYRKHGLTTNNCRLEHMLESKLYSGPLKKGQRCVVLCEGFYEWQTTQSAKPSERAVYYIHLPQNTDLNICSKSVNINLLKIAGLFDTWKDENGDIIYSYSIITFESNKVLSWLHHRTPAILETEQQDWLDFKRVSHNQALSIIRPPTHLSWYRVSNLVNNSRNKKADCNKPLTEIKQNEKSNFLKNWLIGGKRKQEESLKNFSSDLADSDGNEIQNANKLIGKRKKTV